MNDLEKIPIYIGSYSNQDQPGIYVYDFNSENGEITFKEQLKGIENPSYLCLSPDGEMLFAVSEFKDGDEGKVTSYRTNLGKQVNYLTEVDYVGAGSCYITIDSLGKHLFIANYQTGSLVVLGLNSKDNSIRPIQTISFEGCGPNSERQEKSHIHATILSTAQTYVYATDLGADRLYAYHYRPENEQPLSPASPPFISLPAGCGPRHIICHPNGLWLYLLCELSGDLFVFAQDLFEGWIQCCNVAPPNLSGKIEAGDLQIDTSGKYLYATNRGDFDQIIVFKIEEQTGEPSCIQYVSSQGKGPRSLALDPTGQFLLVANEKGNSIRLFNISANGMISYMGRRLELQTPTCIKFLKSNNPQNITLKTNAYD